MWKVQVKIGIVGGNRSESTLDYYKSIISEYQKIKQDGSYRDIPLLNTVEIQVGSIINKLKKEL